MKSGAPPRALNNKSENWPALGDPQEIASAMGDRPPNHTVVSKHEESCKIQSVESYSAAY